MLSRHACSYWHVLECAQFWKFQPYASSGTGVYKHTATEIQSDDKTQFWVKLHHLANRHVLEWETSDQHMESSRQDPKLSEIKTLEHSVKDTANGLWSMKKKWQEHQLCRCIIICSPFPALFLGLDSPNRVPRAMLLHFLWKLRERELIHCGFRSCISYDDKGPPVIVIANCTTQSTGETTLYVNDLNMFVDFLKNHPQSARWEHCARRVVFRLRGVQVSHHISSRMWGNIECKNRQLHSFGCPWRANRRSADTMSGWLEADTSCGRPWARSGNGMARTASKTHGRIDREIVKFDRFFSSLRGNTTASISISQRFFPAKPTSSIAGAKHRMFTHFRMQETRNFRERHAG